METPRNIVGPQIISLRNERGWSQQEFAAICQRQGWDISRGVVARIEGGVRWVSDFELLELAAAFKVAVPLLYPKNKRKAFLAKK